MKINYFKLLVILSFIFLAAYLYRLDFFHIPKVYSPTFFVLSVLVLFCAFILQAVNWQNILRTDHPITLKNAIASSGLSVFTKYIPGKVMVILGRAEYIKKAYGYPMQGLVGRSFDAQMIAILTGLMFGSISLLWLNKFHDWGLFVGLLAVGLSMALFTPYFHRLLNRVLSRLGMKRFEVPFMKWKPTIRAFPSFFVYWMLMSLAFFLFLQSLLPESVSWLSGFIFPLAITLGIVSIFAPGGLGVREGILAGLIHLSGVDLPEATSIAVFSRLWFLVGESFLFLLGFVLSRRN